MFDSNNTKSLWVCPDSIDGDGSYENPFSTIQQALDHAQGGYTIILKSGIYGDDVTFQISGTPDRPIRVNADKDATAIIENSCWFFYDSSDLIISNITFKDSPHGAISVIGTCKRNLFDSIKFINCGTMNKASCTVYFGGTGGEFNVVENCTFEKEIPPDSELPHPENTSIGLMISEGDLDDTLPLRNHLFRRNTFSGYGYGILIGSSNSTMNEYGHVVEYNTIRNCLFDGINVRCGDTIVRGNIFDTCKNRAILISAGKGSTIEDNRIIASETGISVCGPGHSIINNCFIRCGKEAINVRGKSTIENSAATNLFIESNTFFDCGKKQPSQERISGILMEPGTSSIIQKNLFHGEGKPYQVSSTIADLKTDEPVEMQQSAQVFMHDNIASGLCEPLTGLVTNKVVFSNQNSDNLENETGYGASGWMSQPEGFDPNVDECTGEVDYLEAGILIDEDGKLIIPGENGEGNLFEKYYTGVTDQQVLDEEGEKEDQ